MKLFIYSIYFIGLSICSASSSPQNDCMLYIDQCGEEGRMDFKCEEIDQRTVFNSEAELNESLLKIDEILDSKGKLESIKRTNHYDGCKYTALIFN
jgi:hypothetical protein